MTGAWRETNSLRNPRSSCSCHGPDAAPADADGGRADVADLPFEQRLPGLSGRQLPLIEPRQQAARLQRVGDVLDRRLVDVVVAHEDVEPSRGALDGKRALELARAPRLRGRFAFRRWCRCGDGRFLGAAFGCARARCSRAADLGRSRCRETDPSAQRGIADERLLRRSARLLGCQARGESAVEAARECDGSRLQGGSDQRSRNTGVEQDGLEAGELLARRARLNDDELQRRMVRQQAAEMARIHRARSPAGSVELEHCVACCRLDLAATDEVQHLHLVAAAKSLAQAVLGAIGEALEVDRAESNGQRCARRIGLAARPRDDQENARVAWSSPQEAAATD